MATHADTVVNEWYTDEVHTSVLDWIVAVAAQKGLANHHVSFLTLCYVDEYVAKRACRAGDMEWIIVACAWLACKFELDNFVCVDSMLQWHPRLARLARTEEKKRSAQQRIEWEHAQDKLKQLEYEVLVVLDWRLWHESALVAVAQECVQRFGSFDDPISQTASDMVMVVLYALRDASEHEALARVCIDAAAGLVDHTSKWISAYRRGLAVAEAYQAHASYACKMFDALHARARKKGKSRRCDT